MPRSINSALGCLCTVAMMPPRGGALVRGLAGLLLAPCCLGKNDARDLSSMKQTDLKLWVTVDARVDFDNGRVVQWNDISHSENHVKQNNADKSPGFETTPDGGDQITFGNNNAYLSSQPVQLFDTPSSGLTAMVMFKHFKPEEGKASSMVLLNYGAGGLKLQNHNFEVGMKVKDNSVVFFVHRGSGRMAMSKKLSLKPDEKFHLLTVQVAAEAPAEGSVISFALDGKDLGQASEKNKGWLKSGKYPTLSAPVDIGARVDGNKIEGTIGAHMGATADMGFKGVISEVIIYARVSRAA